ncbi:gamma-glutamyltransferase [Aquisalimonas sp. 2447]|uniref:gamma-glutamyltransferase family protein n=1 Tax=Aquisalimonas sp. 2447 TaxID=2740807 RepID=UPI0014325415|nr:gamma-glutamyltransferase [Aquisalimonas sp. 2447]QIT54037.1 gamma-glutamyltransferase [Aquisalimonas sp. 2447]
MVVKANPEPLRAAVVAPHHLAAEAGGEVLAEGGNALEAMTAAAAAIAVTYPHMNGLGGDGFWLVQEPGKPAWGIEACGTAAALATPEWYRRQGFDSIPHRGGVAANTVAGTVSGWALAERASREQWGGRLPLKRLLAPAATLARRGFPMTASQSDTLADKRDELTPQPGFNDVFVPGGASVPVGEALRQPALADLLDRIAEAGPADFYQGDVAATIARELEAAGSPLRGADLADYAARYVDPLSLQLDDGLLANMPPPTQGLASLLILGLYDRVRARHPHTVDGDAYVHALVECTKAAFRVRDRVVTDPGRVPEPPAGLLTPAVLDQLATGFDPDQAAPWPPSRGGGDTVWLGAVDAEGRSVSFIQSLFHEFGSGVSMPSLGIVWQNRGCSFSLDPAALNVLEPGRRPFHTLNPALATMSDGRTVVYGTMGGEGQPQTQAAIYTRAIRHGMSPEDAVAAPRWLLGRTWGHGTDSLKVEEDLGEAVIRGLRERGHPVDVVSGCNSMMGHAGMLVRSPEGAVFASSDPRCDGGVAGVH